MRTLFVVLISGPLFHTSVSQATDLRTTKQLQQLQREVAMLQKELRSVIAIVKVSRGTTHIQAKQHKQEVTGGDERSEIGGDRHTQVGRSRTETIGANQSINVGINQRIMIGKDMTLQVGGNLAENVARIAL